MGFLRRMRVLYVFLDADFFFLEVIFFLAKKNHPPKKISALKKFHAKKRYSNIFFFCVQFFFLAQTPQIVEVVKKMLWPIPQAPVRERGVYGDPMTARVMKQV